MIKYLNDGYVEIHCDKCNGELCDNEVVHIRNNIYADYCEDCFIDYKEQLNKGVAK